MYRVLMPARQSTGSGWSLPPSLCQPLDATRQRMSNYSTVELWTPAFREIRN